jgi:hypothetical protein
MSTLTATVARETIGKLAEKTGNFEVAEKMFGRVLANTLKQDGKTANSQAIEEIARTMGIERDSAIDPLTSFSGASAVISRPALERSACPMQRSKQP